MSLYQHVYIYVLYIYIYIQYCTYINIYIYVYMYICVCMCIYIYILYASNQIWCPTVTPQSCKRVYEPGNVHTSATCNAWGVGLPTRLDASSLVRRVVPAKGQHGDLSSDSGVVCCRGLHCFSL